MKQRGLVQISNISEGGQDEQNASIHSALDSLTVCKASHDGFMFYGTALIWMWKRRPKVWAEKQQQITQLSWKACVVYKKN